VPTDTALFNFGAAFSDPKITGDPLTVTAGQVGVVFVFNDSNPSYTFLTGQTLTSTGPAHRTAQITGTMTPGITGEGGFYASSPSRLEHST
jgi:hypothetical protein